MKDNNKTAIEKTNSTGSLEEYIEQQKKKSAKKKRIIVSVIAIVSIIIAFIVISNVITENNMKKAMEEVTADVSDIAEKYNIDLVCTKGSMGKYAIFTSENFANLTAEKMNSVFQDLENEKGYDVDSERVEIHSQGLRYKVKLVNAHYRSVSDYNGDEKIKPNKNNDEYDFVVSPEESVDHIVGLDDSKMTCIVVRQYGEIYHSTQSTNSKSGSVPAGKRVCSSCHGTGKVDVHYGKSWNQKEGYGYGDVCASCGGTGYVSE